MNSDEIISMLNALQDVIDAERQLTDGQLVDPDLRFLSLEAKIRVLRSSVRTLAVIQRDLLKSVLQ